MLAVSPVAKSTNNTVTVTNPGTDALTLSINGGTGAFSGAFIDPSTGKSTAISGVLFSKQTIGGGYFLSPNTSGSAILAP